MDDAGLSMAASDNPRGLVVAEDGEGWWLRRTARAGDCGALAANASSPGLIAGDYQFFPYLCFTSYVFKHYLFKQPSLAALCG